MSQAPKIILSLRKTLYSTNPHCLINKSYQKRLGILSYTFRTATVEETKEKKRAHRDS